MELYQYKGRNKRGDVMEGTVEAANTEGVVNWMMASGISPISVRLKVDPLKDQPNWLRAIQGQRKLNKTDLLMLTRQLAPCSRPVFPCCRPFIGLKMAVTSPR